MNHFCGINFHLLFACAMWDRAASKFSSVAEQNFRRNWSIPALLVSTLAASSHVFGVMPMQEDHRAVLISGFAKGAADGPPFSSVSVNGIEFVVNTMLSPDRSGHEIGSPIGTCEAIREQIAAFTLGVNAIPEFEAACIALAGDAALLLVQANVEKYPVSSKLETEDEVARWIKTKRRLIFVSVSAMDQSQKIILVK